MKKFFITIFLLFFTVSQVCAAATKIYDENGFRLGTCKKNGETYEAFDLDGNPILKDALNNPIPSEVIYFHDVYGNLMKFSNEKRTIAPTNIEFYEPEHRIYKAPLIRGF